jgi:predicted alpha/beta-hydrolase family hydrolase
MGGRMTSLAMAEEAIPGVRGLAFLGFPLHAAGKPSSDRAEHLARVSVPMLFLQGTRDALASLDLLRPVVQKLGGRARMVEIEHADHGFHVPKKSGRTDDEVLDLLAEEVARWAPTA